jgi:TRAP-type C4-dicarboxylate transport system permease large subunit
MGCARLTDPALRAWRIALDSLGLLAVAYLTATALGGAALVAAWAFEGLTLAQLARHTRDDVARYGSLAFLAGAALHTLAIEAPPNTLLTGANDLVAAAVALGTIAAALLRSAFNLPVRSTQRRVLLGSGAASLIYLASVAIITVFQPGSSEAVETVLDLSVRQQGQVLLSAFWSLVGLTVLIIGLRARLSTLRSAALTVLLIAVAKVFLYDLSTLTSIYRVVSFIVLGLLLLAGAFAYQRLRPPRLPDMRSLHPSQR